MAARPHRRIGVMLVLIPYLLLLVSTAANAEDSSLSRTSARSKAPSVEEPALAEARMAVRVRDFTKAVGIWREAAGRGNARAQYRLGVAYRSGRGIEQDASKAAFWFEKASKGGDRDAQYALGKLYENGLGVPRDRDRAMELIGVAARSGNPEAQASLARIARSRSIAYATAGGRVALSQEDPRAALNQAIRAGDAGSALEALARGAPINGAPGDQKHWRPLLLAVDREQSQLVQLLLEHHADPNRRSRLGEPVLTLAIRTGHREIVRQLLSAGGATSARSKSSYTPLMEAARLGLTRIVEDLLKAGANPKATLADETSAADIARRFRFGKLAARLRRVGAPTIEDRVAANRFAVLESVQPGVAGAADEQSTLPLLIEAARRGDVRLVQEIIASGAKLDVLDPEGDSALHRAAEGGHAEAVRALLAAGLEPDLRGRNESTALLRATASDVFGTDAVVEALLAAGANPNFRDRFAAGLIDYASKGATARKMTLFRAKGASWSASDAGSSLVRAAVAGRLTAFQALLPVATRPTDRAAALCGAISTDQEAVLDILLNDGVDVDRDCGDGRSALLLAAHSGRQSVVAKLLEHGADADQKVSNGDTALIASSSRGHLEITTALLRSGAEVDQRGARQMTALMAAAANGHLDVVRLLLDSGADRRMRGESGRTSLDLAMSAEHDEVAAVIEGHRAQWRAWLGQSGK
jgi:ankyrin repeat protein